MLDLSVIKESYFDIKLPNGDILNLKKCTQGMLNTVIDMGEKIKKANAKKAIDDIYSFATRIINRNKEEKEYTQEQIEDMLSFDVVTYFIEQYITWTFDVFKNPN